MIIFTLHPERIPCSHLRLPPSFLPFEGVVLHIRKNKETRRWETYIGEKGEKLRRLPLEWKSSGWMDASGSYGDGENVLTIDGDGDPTSFNGQLLSQAISLSLGYYEIIEDDGGFFLTKKSKNQESTQQPMSDFMGD
jgi:hypothetical protein